MQRGMDYLMYTLIGISVDPRGIMVVRRLPHGCVMMARREPHVVMWLAPWFDPGCPMVCPRLSHVLGCPMPAPWLYR